MAKYLPLQKLSVLCEVLNVFKAVVDVPSFVHRGHGLLSESSKSKLVITGSALDGLDSTDECNVTLLNHLDECLWDPCELVPVRLHGAGEVEQEVDVHSIVGFLGLEP